jgi:uncharacterized protein (TIGR02118 family)
MIKFSAFYPNGDGARFDFEYYLSRHLPLTRDLVGDALKGFDVEKGLSGGGGTPAPFLAAGHLLFESTESFRAALLPNIERLRSDIPKFTNTQPLIQIGEIVR